MDGGKKYPDSYDPDKLPQLFAILRWIAGEIGILVAIGCFLYALTERISPGGIILIRMMSVIIGWAVGKSPQPVKTEAPEKAHGPIARAHRILEPWGLMLFFILGALYPPAVMALLALGLGYLIFLSLRHKTGG
ncbi:MAG: hypothetical protein EP335_15470 [Alphaproteobacteria bacterium]|nr:MAG: hypothetical protein EP335_15470 [Alphaproteobacteria bacterium]